MPQTCPDGWNMVFMASGTRAKKSSCHDTCDGVSSGKAADCG